MEQICEDLPGQCCEGDSTLTDTEQGQIETIGHGIEAMSFNSYVVDFQGIYCQNILYFKEVAIYNLGEDSLAVYFPKMRIPQLDEKDDRQYQWTLRHHHKIPISFGDHSLNVSQLIPSSGLIYVKGDKKARIVQKFNKNVVNLETLKCPSEVTNFCHMVCPFDRHNSLVNFPHCSLKRAYSYECWVKSNVLKTSE